jgi:DNA polymerase-3 subunit delta
MQIKPQALTQHMQKKIMPFYALVGQDNYLVEESLNTIKSTLKKTYDYDEKKIHIQAPEDWNLLIDEANSYSIFSETVLLVVSFENKSIDATGKKILTDYLNCFNSRCYIILRAPNVPAKQLQWLSNHQQALVVVVYPLNAGEMKSWIIKQFAKNSLTVHPEVPELIYQYNQGNMLACAQVIEKIILNHAANSQINSQHVLEHLSDQGEYSLFELTESCLLGQADRAIHIIRHAANNKTEAILALWVLTQEIRLLLQLLYLTKQKLDFRSACNQLKIWPQRVNFYQVALKRLNNQFLQQLLGHCQKIDLEIKSNSNSQIWNILELLALSLSTGIRLGNA